ncbi:MAG: FAD:protein FMN transferase [Acidimicrobiia bacterium]
MIHHTFHAMGTMVEAWLEDHVEPSMLVDWFESVEEECSRFRPQSTLNRLNDSSHRSVRLDGILGEVLGTAQLLRDETDGLIDAGLGGAVCAWGYDRTFAEVTGLATPPSDLERPEWSLSDGVLTRGPDTRFDLGGIAKGWTCDRAVESGLALVVSAGGDLRSAHPETIVPVIDPWGETAARIELGVGALATSSVTRRRWKVGETEVSHLIDPRTMSPVSSPVLSATVVAETAAAAEAGAKAVLLHGEDGLAWAEAESWIDSAMVIWHDGSVFATHGIAVAA